MSLVTKPPINRRDVSLVFVFPALFLCMAYGLLGLTFIEHPANLMSRCVLMNENLARIWSVAHVEIGTAYLGVFLGMTYYLLKASRRDMTHIRDLGYAVAYLVFSFCLDYTCVRYFTPFHALLIGDAIVMTFTLLVSKQLWFQRLLGIFVPLVFLTCAIGHFMEGLSYWQLTYPVNVPWTMVTADIGFAILVNATRFPAFIRGHDLENEIEVIKTTSGAQLKLLRDVLSSVTGGRLRLVSTADDIPTVSAVIVQPFELKPETLCEFRHLAIGAWQEYNFPSVRQPDMLVAVGEASMNAVVHGDSGLAEVRISGDIFEVWIRDKGPGIHVESIPRATLQRGYSTAGSLGHGFWLILQTVDALYLATSPKGTTVVLTYDRNISNPLESFFG
jgi:anti-sigma regulatory factor (Ser/Thr protein kinase)/Na+-translocating ferredoxin:NAD+ oxidoreductase RnfA subunit